ncbi:MAG: hypothetical protein ABIX10_07275 [Acidimicrobiales bacterium]
MSGCEPEDPSVDAEASDSTIDFVDDVADPWTDDTSEIDGAPSLDFTEPSPYDDPADDFDVDIDATDVDTNLDDPTVAPPRPAWDPPPADAVDEAAGDPWVDLSDDATAAAGAEIVIPELFEDGSLVSQVPVDDDVVTVDEVTATEVYREWETAQGGDGVLVPAAEGTQGAGIGFDRPGMVGDSGDVNFWFKQNEKNSCGPSVAAQIISDFTGVMHTNEYALIGRAVGYDPASGMDPSELVTLLAREGVPARVERDQDFGDVEQYLRGGKSVVMFLDSKDVIGPGYEAFAATDQVEDTDLDTVDHFVRVIGIDRQAGVAIIANSGQDGGAQVEVPLDRLEEAWDDNTNLPGFAADRAHMLVVSDGADPTPDGVLTQPQQPAPTAPVDPQPQPQLTPTAPVDPQLTPTAPVDPQPVPAPEGPAGQVDPPIGTYRGPGEDPAPVRLPTPPSSPIAPAPAVAGDQHPPAPDGPSDVDLHAPTRAFPSAPSTPVEIALPVTPDDALPPAPTPSNASDDDDNRFDDPQGWVLIPVTLAAGRLAMAARDHLAKRR